MDNPEYQGRHRKMETAESGETFEDLGQKLNDRAIETQYIEEVNRHHMNRFIEAGIAVNMGRVAPEDLRQRDRELSDECVGDEFIVDRPVHDDEGNIVSYDLYRYSREQQFAQPEKYAEIEQEFNQLLERTGEATAHKQNKIMAEEVASGEAEDLGVLTREQYVDYIAENRGASVVRTFLHDTDGNIVPGRSRVYLSKRPKREAKIPVGAGAR